ncbi:hypothetical protein ACM66B_006180 [Microbotryomycetes sp. NB124-2]
MSPNRWLYPAPTWAKAQHVPRLVRRLEHVQIERPPAEKAGEAIKKWLSERDATGIFVATIILGVIFAASITACLWETIRYCRKKNSAKGWKRLQERDSRAMINVAGAQSAAWASTPPGRPGHGRWSSLGGGELGLYDPPVRSSPPGLRPLAMSQPGVAVPGQRGPLHGRTVSDTLVQNPRVPHRNVPVSLQPNTAAAIPWLPPPPPPPAPFPVPTPLATSQHVPQSQSKSTGSPDIEVSRSSSLTITNPDPKTDSEPPSAVQTPVRTLSSATNASEKSIVSSLVSEKPPTVDLKRTWTLNSWLPGDDGGKKAGDTVLKGRAEGSAAHDGTRADNENNAATLA